MAANIYRGAQERRAPGVDRYWERIEPICVSVGEGASTFEVRVYDEAPDTMHVQFVQNTPPRRGSSEGRRKVATLHGSLEDLDELIDGLLELRKHL